VRVGSQDAAAPTCHASSLLYLWHASHGVVSALRALPARVCLRGIVCMCGREGGMVHVAEGEVASATSSPIRRPVRACDGGTNELYRVGLSLRRTGVTMTPPPPPRHLPKCVCEGMGRVQAWVGRRRWCVVASTRCSACVTVCLCVVCARGVVCLCACNGGLGSRDRHRVTSSAGVCVCTVSSAMQCRSACVLCVCTRHCLPARAPCCTFFRYQPCHLYGCS
jgi:hypothetical protein